MASFETIREDYVEYFIFSLHELGNEKKFSEDVFEKVKAVAKNYSTNYMWHLDEFKLVEKSVEYHVTDEEADLPSHLYGILHYGENIEDEWFTVFLLMQITKEIPEVYVRVVDSDGEFLLIEAANYLPLWAKPETCNKRVYIHQGEVHLIKPNNNESEIEISNAIKLIADNKDSTKASLEIQEAILRRIEKYPKGISETLHKAIAYVPVGVAAILKNHPNKISHAIRAFVNRDTIDTKVCRSMKFFPPENRVYVNVIMTKFLYAMLTHSKYVPDKRTGWSLPPINTVEYKRHSLGVKIACGFEILASQAKQDSDLMNDRYWEEFLDSLKNKGYFKNAMENSVPYNNLLNKAEEYYRSIKCMIPCTSKIGSEVLDLVKNKNYSVEDFQQDSQNLNEDSESWMNIDPNELDNMLKEQYGCSNYDKNSDDVTGKLKTFLNHVSDVEGVEYPGEKEDNDDDEEMAPVPPPRTKKLKEKGKVTFATDTKVNFDSNAFSCVVQNMLDLVIPEDDWNLESDSDMSAYAEEEAMEECQDFKSKMKDYMSMMDKELAATAVGQSFVKKSSKKGEEEEGTDFGNVEDFSPVDIDLNALKNILESYQAQMGEAGPASNMLGPMGVNLNKVGEKKGNTGTT